MSAAPLREHGAPLERGKRLIRPPDPLVVDTTMRIGPYRPTEATRRYIDLAFRDAYTVLDLTYARGGFWRRGWPPAISLTTSNIDPDAKTDRHLDFTATGLPDGAFDLVVLDPPHLADLGPGSIMRRRFGTVRGTDGLELMIREAIREAWRICSVGIIVKLADHSHAGEYLMLTAWAASELGVRPYWCAQTSRAPFGRSKTLAPRSNGADWLIWRRDGHKLIDFDRRYERQKALRLVHEKRAMRLAKRCAICNAPIGDRRGDTATCSPRCRQKMYRRRLRTPSS